MSLEDATLMLANLVTQLREEADAAITRLEHFRNTLQTSNQGLNLILTFYRLTYAAAYRIREWASERVKQILMPLSYVLDFTTSIAIVFEQAKMLRQAVDKIILADGVAGTTLDESNDRIENAGFWDRHSRRVESLENGVRLLVQITQV